MAAKKQEFTEHDMQSLKHFRSLRKLLVSLHGVGASRDKAGNRELFMDQYCVLVLIWLFNPFPRFIGPTSFPIRIAPRAFSAMRSWSSVLAESTSQSPTIRSGWSPSRQPDIAAVAATEGRGATARCESRQTVSTCQRS